MTGRAGRSPGTLVIEATRRIGTEVPSFCYYPGFRCRRACRMCLVEVEKMPKLQTACTLVALPKAWWFAPTPPQVRDARKYMLEFLLTNHPLDCPVCDKGGECELQDMVFTLRRGHQPLHRRKNSPPRREVVGTGLLRRPALHPVLPLRARVRRRHGRQSPRRGNARRQRA